MSRLELIDIRYEVRLQGIRLEQHMARHAVESRLELRREIIQLRQEIAAMKTELHRALSVGS